MNILYQKTSDGAKMPYKKHKSDYCYDLYATSVEKVAENVYSYGIGIRVEIRRPLWLRLLKPFVNVSIDIRPRSSVWKTGMVLSNCVGTIDELYRGEIKAVFYKVADGEPYKAGDRIAQCKVGISPRLKWIERDIDTNTERGEGGFGSTGR